MARHEIKRHDTRPYWPIALTFDDGTWPDLTGAVVSMICRERLNGTVKFKDSTTVVIIDAPNAEIEWHPLASHTDIAGGFDVEWEVTFLDGTQQTFPTVGYDRLTVIGDLG